MNNKRQFFALLFIAIALIALFFVEGRAPEKKYLTESGNVFGTTYHITYEADSSLTIAIQEALESVNNSLSMFNEHSTISAVNRNDSSIVLDSLFLRVLNKGFEVSKASDGAFDMTVAPLVNLWGFGFDKRSQITEARIDSAKQLVGYEKIHLEGQKLTKDDPRIMLDASAIAKGFGCDVVADALRAHGVENYVVEIGGEIAANGHNAQGNAWHIGINKPIEDSLSVVSEIQQVTEIEHGGMATSGNYRNFYIDNGKKYAHTIDPKSGYPVQHSLLSATIIANDCMTADACATACMVMGLDDAMRFCEENQLQGYFIYVGPDGTYATMHTDGFPIN